MKTFLIIDDDESVVASLRRAFEEMPNVHILQANNLQIAMDAIDGLNPDGLFLDHFLSDELIGEGLEIARLMVGRPIKVYSISLNINLRTRREYESLGVEYLGKDLAGIRNVMDQMNGK